MVCRQCGHDNPGENRYCGMCGTRLAAPAPEKEAEPVSRPESHSRTEPAKSSILKLDFGPAVPESRERSERRPAITGPSFLGLGSEPEKGGSSYLLDDEEPPSHAGRWVFLVVVVAAILFGLQFREQVRQRGGQLYAAVLARVKPEAAPAPTPPAATANAPSAAPENPAAPAAADTPKDAQPASPAASEPEAQAKPPASPAADDDEKPATKAADKPEQADAKPEAKSAPRSASREESRPSRKSVEIARQRKTSPALAPPEDDRMLRLAQQYLHGQGVRRNCDQGMVYLRRALKRPTAAAASQMAALYATGTCVQQDRVSAYRWFTAALQLEPTNPWLARERDEVYGQMNSAERRQADAQ